MGCPKCKSYSKVNKADKQSKGVEFDFFLTSEVCIPTDGQAYTKCQYSDIKGSSMPLIPIL